MFSLDRERNLRAMLARQRRMSVAERIRLFERLSKDAAMARTAKRIK